MKIDKVITIDGMEVTPIHSQQVNGKTIYLYVEKGSKPQHLFLESGNNAFMAIDVSVLKGTSDDFLIEVSASDIGGLT